MGELNVIKKKVGRPNLFTEEIKKKILEAVRMGNYDYIAAKAAGISASTLRSWFSRGRREKDGEYAEFLAAVTEAANSTETRVIAGIIKAGLSDPKHWQWWLERKCPERWGRDTYQIKQLEKEINELKAQINMVIGGQGVKVSKKAKSQT